MTYYQMNSKISKYSIKPSPLNVKVTLKINKENSGNISFSSEEEVRALLDISHDEDTGAVFTFGRSHFADNEPSHFFIKNDPIVAISCGDEHSAVICQNGRVFVFGGNVWGQLGLGHKDAVSRPSCVKWLKPHRALFVACGRAHTVFVTDTHAIYTVGCNDEGQLGTGDTEHQTVPQYVELECDEVQIKQVSAGSNHTAILTDNGRVFVCGSNTEGQLGLGEEMRTCLKFTELKFMEKISFVECGYYHTVFITADGAVFVTGDNEGQKLGIVTTADKIYVPEVSRIDTPIKGACCGASHTFLLSMDETKIFAFGSNEKGQLGLPSSVENVPLPTEIPMDKMFEGYQLKLVACGAMHTAFVTDNGLLYTCGESRHNKLCLEEVNDGNYNNDANQYLPKRVTAMNGYIVDNVACGGCHTLLTATKGSNADFTNNDFSVLTEQTRQVTLTELPPLQKVPGAVINKTTEDLPFTIDDMTNSNIEGTINPDTNGNPVNCEDIDSIDSLEANVSGSHIVNINDLENVSISGIPELNKDDENKPDVLEMTEIVATDIKNNIINKPIEIINKVKTEIQTTAATEADKLKTEIAIVEETIIKKMDFVDPNHKCEELKSLGIPKKLAEIQNSPPPKSPILEELLHVPNIAQMSPDFSRRSDDGQKSESGSKSENETLQCASDKSSPQIGKTAKTQAVLPIVRNEDNIDMTDENFQNEDSEVVVQKNQDKGRFAKMFQSIRDKENSCMSKGKVIEDTVVENVHKGVDTAEETIHKVEETVETEIRNQTNSRTCTIL